MTAPNLKLTNPESAYFHQSVEKFVDTIYKKYLCFFAVYNIKQLSWRIHNSLSQFWQTFYLALYVIPLWNAVRLLSLYDLSLLSLM